MRPRQALRLLFAGAAIAVIWMVVLPWCARQPGPTRYRQELDRRGVDPAAMFYTDLPVMERILQKIERRKGGSAARGS